MNIVAISVGIPTPRPTPSAILSAVVSPLFFVDVVVSDPASVLVDLGEEEYELVGE